MSIFSSASEARLGALGIPPLLPLPSLPNIIAEWAAILPLVCHLASQRADYITTGDVALMGRLSVGIFPRLGTLSGLARLLGRGTKYLDHASTRGGSSRTVWDVQWGSVFPCANGAACTAISSSLRSDSSLPAQRMPDRVPSSIQTTNSRKSLADDSATPSRDGGFRDRQIIEGSDEGFRRCQILNVYQLSWTNKQPPRRDRVNKFLFSTPGQILTSLLSVAFAVFLGLVGSYGSAALVICTTLSELAVFSVTIRRPTTYLQSGESHNACMLVASHANAAEWHLYIGNRAIADTILNKPMFAVPEGKSAHLAAKWFSFAHLLQLAAMTFAAAQKGWDGVSMLALLVLHWALYRPFHHKTLATAWLEREGIGAEVRRFEYGGRHVMLGSIQMFSGSEVTRWMDEILVPHPRREAWLECLRGKAPTEKLSKSDAEWLEHAVEASIASAAVLKSLFTDRVESEESI